MVNTIGSEEGEKKGTSTKLGFFFFFGRRKTVVCVNECWIISNFATVHSRHGVSILVP